MKPKQKLISERPNSENIGRIKAYVKKFWQQYAPFYADLEFSNAAHQLARDFKRTLDPRPGEVWLDLGSAQGNIVRAIFDRSQGKVAKIYCVDLFNALDVAKLQNIPYEFVECDLTEGLPMFPDNFFDGISANLVITYLISFGNRYDIDGLEFFFKELARVLKPGGRIIWSTPVANPRFWMNYIHSIPSMLLWFTHGWGVQRALDILKYANEIARLGKIGVFNFLQRRQYVEIMRKAGLCSASWKKSFTWQVHINYAEKLKFVG